MRPVLADVLEEEGFIVDACESSDTAINLAREQDYDLMVADIRMDGLDGLAALSHVQSYRPGVDALVVSGYADAEQAERASRLGLGAVLMKPFQLDVFLHKVNSLLKARTHKIGVRRAFESLLKTSYWSSRQLARFLDKSEQKRYSFSDLVDITGLLCTEMNLLGSQLEKVRSAALAAAWQQSQKYCLLEAPTDIPDEFQDWFAYLGEWWNGKGPKECRGQEIPLESRIIVTALAASLATQTEETLEEKWPGRFDPALVAILDQNMALSEDSTAAPASPNEVSSDSLLNLAGTLLRSGDFHHASEALQEVIRRGAESREGVSALIMLARLKQRSGLFEEAKQMAFRTPELAQAFGPALAAHAFLQSGKLLMDLSERTHAGTTLRKALAIYEDLGLEAQAAECGLLANMVEATLGDSEDTHRWLELLLSPQHRTHAANLAEPLIEALLSEGKMTDPLAKSLARLCLANPYAAGAALGSASRVQQERALELFERAGAQKFHRLIANLVESPHESVRRGARALSAGTSGAKDALPLNVRTLGGFTAEIGDHQIPDRAWKTKKVKYLLARLIDAYPKPVNEDLLIEEFWPGDMEKGRRSLYTATSSIRSALRKAGLESSEYVEKTLGGLVLSSDIAIHYDLLSLKEALVGAKNSEKTGNIQEAMVGYRKAILIGEKPYLPGCYYDWALGLRDSTEQELLEACVRLTEISFVNERHHEAIEFARRALTYDSANETATGLLLESLVEVGRPAEAYREFQNFNEVLKKELGVADATTFVEVRRRAVEAARR